MLNWLGSIEFREPWLLLAAVLAIPIFLLARRAPGRVQFSSFLILPGHSGSWRTRLAWVPDAALALAAVALAVALAGPRIGEQYRRVETDRIVTDGAISTTTAKDAAAAERRGQAPTTVFKTGTLLRPGRSLTRDRGR